jgi:hypothetical protein
VVDDPYQLLECAGIVGGIHRRLNCCTCTATVQVFRDEGLIYMVLEYGDIDLARLLHNHEETRKAASVATTAADNSGSAVATSSGQLDENFIRLYWQQMLQASKRSSVFPPSLAVLLHFTNGLRPFLLPLAS